MKRTLLVAVISIAVLLVVPLQSLIGQHLDPEPHPAGEPQVETMCMHNHFSGVVRDCCGNPVSGETVTLTYPDGKRETSVTNSEGRYCFAKPIPFGGSAWKPGHYGLTTRCMGKLVYRDGDGNIEIDLSVCCPGG